MRSFKRFLILLVLSFQLANSALADSESELRLVGNAMKIKVEEMRQRVNSIRNSNASTLNMYLDRCAKRFGGDSESKKKKNLQIERARQFSNLARIKSESEFQIISKKVTTLRNTYINDCNLQNTRDKYEYCVVLAFQLDNVKLLQDLSKDLNEYINQSTSIGNSYFQCYEGNVNSSFADLKEIANMYDDDYKFIKEYTSKIGEAADSLLRY